MDHRAGAASRAALLQNFSALGGFSRPAPPSHSTHIHSEYPEAVQRLPPQLRALPRLHPHDAHRTSFLPVSLYEVRPTALSSAVKVGDHLGSDTLLPQVRACPV